ncbi:unnamed protein product [Closterium sp. NIES-54]
MRDTSAAARSTRWGETGIVARTQQQFRFMVFGQIKYLSPQATVQRAKLKTGTTILVLPVDAVDHGEGLGEAEIADGVAAGLNGPAAAPLVGVPDVAAHATTAPARRIDHSKWDHLHSSRDEEDEDEKLKR